MKIFLAEKYMQQSLELAKKGAGNVSPNPMVGCVIVHQGKVIGEGYHEKYGENHAEVNAINSVADEELLKESVLYVTLEPCAHYGLTPPCSNLIIEKKIPKVVVGTIDPFDKVAGKGIERMKNAGIDVTIGMLENQCREINKRFFTYHEKKRPYIFLKWAQTSDGFIDMDRSAEQFGQPNWITGKDALQRVHQMRAKEDAIMVGTTTALKDNPSLTVRHVEGKNPIRIVLDNQLRLPQNLNLFDGSVPTLVFNSIKNEIVGNTHFIRINFVKAVPTQIINELYLRKIQSVIIEGGKQLIESFIEAELWDEAFVFVGEKKFYSGVKAPQPPEQLHEIEIFGNDELYIYKNLD
ncbi:MAG: bifunctional diaminohydroxyphosphoribosylaminopyrimidine deaminase/5-amino-6-(5-phosphoribosylamino)uracil reductase RibD [Prolixibacteraceae bacterium]|nr:bifunctional diaminohydroxyphosphoribosylaminopyrimidine deaminase/5-amino-6-(5-phosphoribosylamino)uracil reductase RibD [Prolixibacteraceae bacterium]